MIISKGKSRKLGEKPVPVPHESHMESQGLSPGFPHQYPGPTRLSCGTAPPSQNILSKYNAPFESVSVPPCFDRISLSLRKQDQPMTFEYHPRMSIELALSVALELGFHSAISYHQFLVRFVSLWCIFPYGTIRYFLTLSYWLKLGEEESDSWGSCQAQYIFSFVFCNNPQLYFSSPRQKEALICLSRSV
jgi:hypothetical protein